MLRISVSFNYGGLQERKRHIRVNPKEVSQRLLSLRFDEIFRHRHGP